MNRMITIVIGLALFSAQAGACTYGGRRSVLYHCCGHYLFVTVCTAGGVGKCEELISEVNCGCTWVGGAGNCLSAECMCSGGAPAARESEQTTASASDSPVAGSAKGLQCSGNTGSAEDSAHLKSPSGRQ